MNQIAQTFRLLIAHDSAAGAEHLARVLQEANEVSHVETVLEQAHLDDALTQGGWDVLLLRPVFDGGDLANSMAFVRRHGRVMPVVVLQDELNADVLRASLQFGVHGVAQFDDMELLLQVLNQQFAYVTARRKQQQAELAALELRQSLAAVLSHSRDGIAYIVDGAHLRTNEAYRKLFGVANEAELVDVPAQQLIVAEEQAAFAELLNQPPASASAHEEIFTAVMQNGSTLALNFSFVPISYSGGSCIQLIVRASKTPELDQQIQQMRQLDALTNLYNRNALMEQIENAVAYAVKHGEQYAALHLRLNDFLLRQGEVGVVAADEALLQVASMLRDNTPANAVVARMGSFEFGVLCPINKLSDAEVLAQHLADSVRQLLPAVGGMTMHLTACVGVAFVQEDSQSANQVMTRALNSCNRAQEADAAVYVYDPLDEVAPGSDAAFALSLKKALVEEGLIVRYQPILKISDNAQQFVEVTAILKLPDGEEVQLDELMYIAVSYGLNQSIDQLIISQALREAAAAPVPPRLLINLSGHSVQAAGFVAWVGEQLQQSGYDPSLVTFQITQADAHHFLKQVQAFVVAIANYGCRFAVSGYLGDSKLAAVHRHLPVSLVRCAPEFVTKAGVGELREQLSDAVNVVKEKGTEVLVPYVESAQQMQAVWSLPGVDYLQGSYLQLPSANLYESLGDD